MTHLKTRGLSFRILVTAFVASGMIASMTRAGASTLLLSDGFSALPLGTSWADGTNHGNWYVQYNGYGHVGAVDLSTGRALYERPLRSTTPDDTHASLVTSRRSFGDIDMTLKMQTISQIRTGSAPNPWEVAWAFWNYTDDDHFYSVVLKPNGWELGKEDPAYPGAQRYLATGSSPRFPIGAWYRVRVQQIGATITVWVNGVRLVSTTDGQRPYKVGSVGLYNEDSAVAFDDVVVSAP